MAIRTFKEIIDNKAYRLSSNDRDIFEQGNLQSFFGLSDDDIIEFILFDANDNQLPQGASGKLVRYIPMNSSNIRDYFMVADGTMLQSLNFPSEYFIDVAKLTKEAGYQTGIFKVQVTLLNRRIGSDALNDKMWISEISPSRTELKLLPLRNGKNANRGDLLNRFRIFVDGSGFRSDILPQINQFIESIDLAGVRQFMQSTYGDSWVNAFKSEYGVDAVDDFIKKVYDDFVQSMKYEFSNRISDLGDVNYGQLKQNKQDVRLSRRDVMLTSQRILVQSIIRHLPNRSIQANTEYDINTALATDGVVGIINDRGRAVSRGGSLVDIGNVVIKTKNNVDDLDFSNTEGAVVRSNPIKRVAFNDLIE